MEGHINGRTYARRDIHMEEHRHGGVIYCIECVDVLNHLLDGLSTRWTKPICSTGNLFNENGADSLNNM